jgi:hypothetical protein
MWKASAIKAREPTHIPTPNSSIRKITSITSIIVMRVDFDHPILTEEAPQRGS